MNLLTKSIVDLGRSSNNRSYYTDTLDYGEPNEEVAEPLETPLVLLFSAMSK